MLNHIYWIGGSACAGKSTIASLIVEQYDLLHYQVDFHTQQHQARANAETHPTFWWLNQLSGDALWMRPLEEQVQGAIQYCTEQFALVLEDLLALPTSKPILAEGNTLLPHLVAPLLNQKERAIWLVPQAEFQYAYYAQRPWIHEVLASCRQPSVAFDNWMRRDVGFADWVEGQAEMAGLRCMRVDGSTTLLQNMHQVCHHFGLSPAQ